MLRVGHDGMDRAGLTGDHAQGVRLWVVLSGGVSLGVVGLGYVLLRRFGRWRWMQDSFAGQSVVRTQAMLDEIERFEKE